MKEEKVMSELVSVVVPVYNVVDYLDRCLCSIVNQTYKNLEIILIDDGSTDGSTDKCKKWASIDKRIQLYTKKNEGLGAARNDGIDRSVGKYIAFIDSDDWWELNAIEQLIMTAEKYDADMVYMNFYWEYQQEDGSYKNRIFYQYCIYEGVTNAQQHPELIFSNDARTWSKFYRLNLWKEHTIRFPNHPFEDFPINPMLVLASDRICQIPQALYHYNCKRTGSLTDVLSSYLSIPIGLEELYTSLKKKNYIKKYENDFKQYAIQLCRNVINENRIQSEEGLEVFWNFLNSYCAAEMEFYKTNFAYIGSFAGYQLLIKNVFDLQIIKTQICNIPKNQTDSMNIQIGKIGDIDNVDFIVIDLLDNISVDSILSCLLNVDESCKYDKMVILLRLYYAEYHGVSNKNKELFDDVAEIRKKNEILKYRYDELESKLGNKVISIIFDELDNYAYEYTSYGCKPEYFNGKFYHNAFNKLKEEVENAKRRID